MKNMMKPYTDIKTISESIWTKEISPVEVLNECLKRIEELDPELNAFITVLPDQAREQAGTAEAEIKVGNWRGSLH
jgi:aspartyl-tRNA(Asn)/glutamyl-tRNA(Gln) amidotransferase subunit A